MLLLVSLSTIGLYGGGVVLNDVFDAELDRRRAARAPDSERPRLRRRSAALFGTVLLLFGIGAAFMVGTRERTSRDCHCRILSAVCYDAWTKEHPIVGPLNMGFCRGLNLLLGLSAAPLRLFDYAPLGAGPAGPISPPSP
ncbi:MAG: UbiA family prenyltransferase [Candidatus Manganitrophus sp.]|nr:UbiA family prenyltransferase [Candidatus Manganitrophus sp.]